MGKHLIAQRNNFTAPCTPSLPRPGHLAFNQAPRTLWQVNNRTMGYLKKHAHLTQLVIRNTGHMGG